MRYFEVVKDEHRKNQGEIKLPTRGSQHSAGYDFYSPIDITIQPNESALIFTDVKAHMYYDNVLFLFVRSSMGKHPIVIANGTGIIDADYYSNEGNDGNIGIFLKNISDETQRINKGDRIAQGAFFNFLVADNGNTDNVRTGGFGSTN
jgi:dUTP pyrophosphatase